MLKPGEGPVLLFRPVADPVSRCGGAWIPYSILSLAGAVSEAGFPVRLADGYHDGSPNGILDAQDGRLALIGITAASAHQVREGLAFARLARERFPGVPLVWGGPQAGEHPLADAVIRGPAKAPCWPCWAALRPWGPRIRARTASTSCR